MSVQLPAPLRLPLSVRAYLPIFLLALLIGMAATAAPASAGKFEPPRQFQEGEKFLAEHGSRPCTAIPTVDNPNAWEVGTLEVGNCFLTEKTKAYGLTIDEGNCGAFGDLTKPSSEDGYGCGFAFRQGKELSNAGSCFWSTYQDEEHKFDSTSELWSREYEKGQYETLARCMAAQGTEPPVARCDAYWVKPHGQLTVGVPGVLGNDSSPADLPLTAVVDKINFGVKDHPYRLNPATGALRFTPNSTPDGKPFAARITYHVKDSAGRRSNRNQRDDLHRADSPRGEAPGMRRQGLRPIGRSRQEGQGKGEEAGPDDLEGDLQQAHQVQ